MAKKKGITKEQVLEMIDMYADGMPVKDVLKKYDIKYGSLYHNLKRFDLVDNYACARELYCQSLINEIDEIKEDLKKGKIDPASARVIIDANKWELSKFYPKMYGDKLDLTSKGKKIGGDADLSKLSNEDLATYAILRKKINGVKNDVEEK